MKKWMLACLLLLQGCDSGGGGGRHIQEEESVSVMGTMDEQLLQASKDGHADKVRQLIQNGANLDVQDAKGRTPLMIATYNKDFAVAEVLTEAGADVNLRDGMLNSPFLYAGAEGYLDILRLTIDAGADTKITNRYGGIAIIPASEHGYVEVVRELLERTDTNVNHVNNLGWTALLEAIILNNGNERQVETVKLLIEHGADVNLSDNDDVTPLQHARKRGFKEIEQLLVNAGAK
ncbi:ankyrin repeat domain-containing protein [Paenibacillus sp. MMO-58]|uniref:ankyrin repeat domain-containing protein n=1 Tax=Paenibacillus sp. MMO-58 TaxID=3081290 RepID=UPI003016F963